MAIRKGGELQGEPLRRAVGPVRQERNPVSGLVHILADELFPAAGVDVGEILNTLVGDEARTRWALPRVADRPLVMLIFQLSRADRLQQPGEELEELLIRHSLSLVEQRLRDLRPAPHSREPSEVASAVSRLREAAAIVGVLADRPGSDRLDPGARTRRGTRHLLILGA